MKKYNIQEQTKDQIKEIQSSLNKCFSAGLAVDGIVGPKTAAAIQKHLGITLVKK
jgi:lysozyme family protein